MIPLHAVLETEHVEVFPFFKWKLFTHIPDWEPFEYVLIADSVDGQSMEGTTYLIPSGDIRDWKALRRVASACAKDRGCTEQVTEVLYPIIKRKMGERTVEFSIIKADVDLHDVQDNLTEFANGEMTRTDFLQPGEVVVRWSTSTGRLPSVPETG